MKWLIIKNDLKRNQGVNLALFLFLIFSAGLAVMSVAMGVQTFTSISELYKTAQPPHFVQMHKGEINRAEIDEFMSSYDGITYRQVSTMIDVFGEISYDCW
jgi:putative ABC transport system permease protein